MAERYVKEECLKYAVEITRAYAQSGENKHGPVPEFLEGVFKRLLELRERYIDEEDERE